MITSFSHGRNENESTKHVLKSESHLLGARGKYLSSLVKSKVYSHQRNQEPMVLITI